MQLHELEAWLGDGSLRLTADQLNELLRTADEISERYPDPDDQIERDAALSTAYQLMATDQDVVEGLARERDAAKNAELQALAGLRQAAVILIPRGDATEYGFAKKTGIDRMTVRRWLGKR
ncbi:hypothetical protein AB0D56_30855 [Streptomyces sp. NPDC048209]|uniref:hypothetical protein n=1 Tax=Streptomyces sp. NPDC048209 TaxID=3156689 RepID=UPI003449D29B